MEAEIDNKQETLKLELIGFSADNLKIVINQAKIYDLDIFENKKNLLFTAFSGLLDDFDGDIFLQDKSIKTDVLTRSYLHKNSLILDRCAFLNENLTVRENLQIISYFWNGFDLADAGISSFNLKEQANKKVYDLTQNEKKMVVLAFVVVCPAIIWLIDKKWLQNLQPEQKSIFDNSANIRTKHGGVVIFV